MNNKKLYNNIAKNNYEYFKLNETAVISDELKIAIDKALALPKGKKEEAFVLAVLANHEVELHYKDLTIKQAA